MGKYEGHEETPKTTDYNQPRTTTNKLKISKERYRVEGLGASQSTIQLKNKTNVFSFLLSPFSFATGGNTQTLRTDLPS